MTQEEKQILLKDLSSRLSYGVICHTEEGDGYLCSINQTIFGTEYGLNISPIKRDYFNDSEQDEVVIKPYLRPMSSMTEEERKEWYKESHVDYDCEFQPTPTLVLEHCHLSTDWLLKYHFDYRGLIPMGLALEAHADMYKTE